MKFVFGIILFTSAVLFNFIELSSSADPPGGPGPSRPNIPPPFGPYNPTPFGPNSPPPVGPNNPPRPFGPNDPRPHQHPPFGPFGPWGPGPQGPGPHPFQQGSSRPYPPEHEVEAAILRRLRAEERYMNSLMKNLKPPGKL